MCPLNTVTGHSFGVMIYRWSIQLVPNWFKSPGVPEKQQKAIKLGRGVDVDRGK